MRLALPLAANLLAALAWARSNAPAITHHKTTDLKGLVAGGKLQATIPTGIAGKQQSTLKGLEALQFADFTNQYHSIQVGARKDTVDLFKRYGGGREKGALKAWVAATLPRLQLHLDMALNK